MYKVEVTPVVGLPQFTGWSHVATSHSRFGECVCAFAVKGEHAGNVGRDLTELISNFPVNSATDLHELLAKLEQTATGMDTQLAIAAGLCTSTAVIIGALRGSIFLKRDQRMGVLLTAVDDIKIVEGKRKSGDVVVLATHQAQSVLPEIEQRFRTGFEVDSVISSIIPGLHSNHDSSLSSLAFITGGKEIEDVEDVTAGMIEIDVRGDEPPLASSRLTDVQSDQSTQSAQLAESAQPQSSTETSAPPTMASDTGAVGPSSPVLAVVPSAKKPPMFKRAVERLQRVPFKMIAIGFGGGLKKIMLLLKNGLVSLVRWLITTVRQIRSKDVYVQGQSPRKALRTILPIALVVVVVVGIVIWRLVVTRTQVKAAETAMTPHLERLSKAREVLNNDPLMAREEAKTVIGDLQQLEQEFAQRKAGQKVISKQLAEAWAFHESISGLESVQELEIFYDLHLISSDFVATQVDANIDRAVFLDKDRKQAIILTPSTKQARQISLDSMGRALAVAINDETVTFLGDGIFQATVDAAEVTRVIDEGDSNRGATHLESFASYLYALNPEKRNIYRYSRQEDKYSDPIGWVSGAVSFDFNNVYSWTIDGEVWIGSKDGKIHRLASGREQTFEIKGLATAFAHPLAVYTQEDFTKLYVLESDAKRLVVLNKDGTFLKEVSSPSLGSATGLFVDEANNTAYAVSGSIIYSVKL